VHQKKTYHSKISLYYYLFKPHGQVKVKFNIKNKKKNHRKIFIVDKKKKRGFYKNLEKF